MEYQLVTEKSRQAAQTQISDFPVCFSGKHCVNSSPEGAQWVSGRVLDSSPRDGGFEPHRRHCVVVLEQDTFILA